MLPQDYMYVVCFIAGAIGVFLMVRNVMDVIKEEGFTVSYRRVSTTGEFGAFVSQFTRDAERLLTSFRTEVQTPDGDGLSLFSEIVRDGATHVSGYKEVRTFGEEGVDPEHTLVVSDIERLSGSGQVRYKVEYTDPDGNSETFIYPPWQLTD